MEPSSSFIVTCNLVKNLMGRPDNIMYSFTVPNATGFGDLISPVNEIVYSKIKPGTYSEVTIEIYDQNYLPLEIVDNNMLITLSIIKAN